MSSFKGVPRKLDNQCTCIILNPCKNQYAQAPNNNPWTKKQTFQTGSFLRLKKSLKALKGKSLEKKI